MTEKPKTKLSEAEVFYKRFMRFSEIYIFACFLLIITVPLLEYAWVPGFTRAVYLTAFPLFAIVLIISAFRDPFISLLGTVIKDKPDNSPAGKLR